MEEALTATPQEGEQERRRRTSPLFWLVWAVLIFCTLFWCGQLATRGSTGARPEGGASGLSADYRPWPGLLFGPVGPGFIEDLQKALGAIGPPSGSGDCLLGAVCAPIPTDTPTPTRTAVPSLTPTPTHTPTRTRTAVPSWTPTRMKDPPTATPPPSCDNVDRSLSVSGTNLVMSLTNYNSGAMHLTSSSITWPLGQALTALSLDTGPSYGTGLPDSSGSNTSSPSSPPPLPSGGSHTWEATFDSVGPGMYDVTLNFGCPISGSLNVTATPVPPTADMTATAQSELDQTATAQSELDQTATAQSELDQTATAAALTATAAATTPSPTP